MCASWNDAGPPRFDSCRRIRRLSVAGHPLGPKRSVRICCGRRPASSRRRTAASTKPFEPQTNALAECVASSAISEESIRPVWPSQPAGGSRVKVSEHRRRARRRRSRPRPSGPNTQAACRAQASCAPMAQHRHQRHHARPAADEQHGSLAAPYQITRRTARGPRHGRPRRRRRGSRAKPRHPGGGRWSAGGVQRRPRDARHASDVRDQECELVMDPPLGR